MFNAAERRCDCGGRVPTETRREIDRQSCATAPDVSGLAGRAAQEGCTIKRSSFRSHGLLLVACLILFIAQIHAEELPFERGLVLIKNELQIAGTGLRALNVAAHPDDEDGGTLSYLRQNWASRHICFYPRAVKADRTKQGQNLAQTWLCGVRRKAKNRREPGHENLVSESAGFWLFEIFRRSAESVGPRQGAGTDGANYSHRPATHHFYESRSGRKRSRPSRRDRETLVEAFDAAADAQKFPEQMKEDGTQPWAASKLYVRRFAPPQLTLTVDISERDPLSGLSDREIAAYALTKHLSQGMQRQLKPGEKEFRYFTLLKTKKPDVKDASLLAGIDLQSPPTVQEAVNAALKLCEAKGLADGTLQKAMADACKEAEKVNGPVLNHLHRAFGEALGIKVQLRCDDPLMTFDERNKVILRVANSGLIPVSVTRWQLQGEQEAWQARTKTAPDRIAPGESVEFNADLIAAAGAYPSYPRAQYIFRAWKNAAQSS